VSHHKNPPPPPRQPCTEYSNPPVGHGLIRSVLEFTAPEGTCYLPYWMMSNLTLTEGKRIRVRNVSLPKATFVKFQPQSVDFLDITNPRAVLEYKLRSFSCVTVGDHLAFSYNDKKYYLEVKDVKPQDAACIIEADVNVDFDAPVGYKEPERVPAAPPKPILPEVQKAKLVDDAPPEAPKFSSFTGSAVRLDGKPLKPSQAPPQAQAEDAMDVDGAATQGAGAASSGGGGGSGGSGNGHTWGSAAGSIKSGNLAAAERRAAMLAAAEARSSATQGGASSLSAAPASPAKKAPAPTKWSKSAKMGRFQNGGHKLS